MSWFLSSSFHYWVLISKWNHLHPSISFLITLISLYDYIIRGCIQNGTEEEFDTTWTFQDDTNEAVIAIAWLWLGYSFQTSETDRRELWTQHSFMFYTPPFSFLVHLHARPGPLVQLCSPQSFQYHRSFLASSRLFVFWAFTHLPGETSCCHFFFFLGNTHLGGTCFKTFCYTNFSASPPWNYP